MSDDGSRYSALVGAEFEPHLDTLIAHNGEMRTLMDRLAKEGNTTSNWVKCLIAAALGERAAESGDPEGYIEAVAETAVSLAGLLTGKVARPRPN